MSRIKNPNAREMEMLACLEATLKKLAEAQDYIKFLGGCDEAIQDIQTALDLNPYLNRHGITIPVFKHEPKEMSEKEEREFQAIQENIDLYEK